MHVSVPQLPSNTPPTRRTSPNQGFPRLPPHPPLLIQFRNELIRYQESHLSLRSRWWRAISLYAFAKWRTAYKGHPVGIPGERDPLFPCSAYLPRPRQENDSSLCETDQHYLCHLCVENKYNHPMQDAIPGSNG